MTEAINEQPKVLLFVEDEPDIVTLYKSTFEKNGFSVDATDNGTDALKRVESYRTEKGGLPNVMVFDILLPDKISGMDILREVRKHSEFDAVPVIMFTNFSSDEFRKEIEGMKNARYLLKLEATPKQLVEEIKRMLDME
ncbi:MAG: response regulator [bacterium]